MPHVFQNLGDGTYYHSGYLAIRQAVAAKARITSKILFNDAVAMTGGQPVDGVISVDAIARQVESEGVQKVVVLSDDIGKYAGIKNRFPAGTGFHDRGQLDAVQRGLRAIDGVTVLIYEQTCAAEKRRRRKKGELVDPDLRLFINEAVCEGCGDCGVQSNCVALLPHETALGRKRKIDQTACNKDYSCAQGFCPSFVGVRGGKLRKKAGALTGEHGQGAFAQRIANLPEPAPHPWSGPYDLLVTGVGGTGVVTVGALVAMAAHLEGNSASVLDFTGFAQKGGAVLSFVRLADRPDRLNQVRIDTQQADAVLACDSVVAAQPEALGTVRHGRTRILVNVHETPVAESLRNPDASLKTDLLLAKLRFAAGEQRVETFDAQTLAEDFLGDTVTANVLALGYAWQRALVPVSLAALQRAIELNGVAVAANQTAFALGRLAAADPDACAALLGEAARPAAHQDTLEQLIADDMSHLTAYQNAAYAERYAQLVRQAQAREQAVAPGSERFTRAVARSLHKLMSYKDEYEVARLFTDGAFQTALAQQFEGELKLSFFMAPPLLSCAKKAPTLPASRGSLPPKGAFLSRGGPATKNGEPPRKRALGAWLLPAMRLLAKGRTLRGGALDVFGKTAERHMERQLIAHYENRVRELLPQLSAANLPLAADIAAVPMSIRGFGHVKQANLVIARAREAELLHRLDAGRYPRPAAAAGAGQLRGIPVVAA
jgi:indolepyruvate ferredoxin oxidoreductase